LIYSRQVSSRRKNHAEQQILHCGSITQISLNARVTRNVGATRAGDIHAVATLSASILIAKGLKNAPSV
jgi:hypothetical protein